LLKRTSRHASSMEVWCQPLVKHSALDIVIERKTQLEGEPVRRPSSVL
jgi:hypothetical protein